MSEAVTQSIRERIPTSEELGFDPGLLREKYAAERARAAARRRQQPIPGNRGSVRALSTPILTLSRASRVPRCTKNST